MDVNNTNAISAAGDQPSAPALSLKGHQLALLKALQKIDDNHSEPFSIADMYYGGLSVLADDKNPERNALSAHCFRELIEKLPLTFDIPIPHHSGNMGEKVNILKVNWEKALNESDCNSDNEWKGEIDQPLKQYLDASRDYFQWHKKYRLTRTELPKRLSRKLDPSDDPMPSKLENIEAETWIGYRNYFDGVSHHTLITEDHPAWIEHFERFLLDRLIPRTFNDQAEIDKIIS